MRPVPRTPGVSSELWAGCPVCSPHSTGKPGAEGRLAGLRGPRTGRTGGLEPSPCSGRQATILPTGTCSSAQGSMDTKEGGQVHPRGKQGGLAWDTEWGQDWHCACWVFPLRAERAPLTQNQMLGPGGRGRGGRISLEARASWESQMPDPGQPAPQTKVPLWPCPELSPRKQEGGGGCVWPTCWGSSNALGSRLLR